jgi:bifunctional non-homologous end joining protein LigD
MALYLFDILFLEGRDLRGVPLIERKEILEGKVGTGFSHKTSMQVRRKLEPLITPQQKLTKKVRKPKAKWVEPKFFAEVEYRDITADGLLRQSSFKGMSE